MDRHRAPARPGHGGAGTHRGGLGQVISVRTTTGRPWQVALLGDREHHPPRGLLGGSPALGTAAAIDGEPVSPVKSVTPLAPDATVDPLFAGGVGFGPADQRDPAAVTADVRLGYLTPEAAARDYPGHDPQRNTQ
ncbi:hydantoinase B/oxoprolinase family protein [Actinomadura welshii]|uniref:hydantoinase B/oxoprolinase family protein n=1 Tax=Actinomadura welshii TaxID=3103817 RepID=UPI00190F092C|nr:hydantoinase B/oxoprolinase family protein [Actinomadura madurae]